jgi:hypothetical protein
MSKMTLTKDDPEGWYECQRMIDDRDYIRRAVWWNGTTIEASKGCFPHHPVYYYRDFVLLVPYTPQVECWRFAANGTLELSPAATSHAAHPQSPRQSKHPSQVQGRFR